MDLLQELGIHDVDGKEWSNLVLAVFQVELSAIGRRHNYSAVHVKSANRQLDTDTKNRMHSSFQAAAKAHGTKKQELWRCNSGNSASQFGGPIAFEEEDCDALMMAVLDVLLEHGAQRINAFELWDMARAIFEMVMANSGRSLEFKMSSQLVGDENQKLPAKPRGPTKSLLASSGHSL